MSSNKSSTGAAHTASKKTTKGRTTKDNKTKGVKSIGQSASSDVKVERKPGIITDYNVFVVYSRMALASIIDVLEGLNAGAVGPCRIDYDREGNETNRTIVVADKSVFETAVSAGLDRRIFGRDFTIARYELREHNAPREGHLYKFFIRLPHELSLSGAEVLNQVTAKFNDLVEFGILPAGGYKISVPLKSRETGDIKGGAFVTFNKSVDPLAIQLAKVIIDDTYWVTLDKEGEEEFEILRCLWARERKSKEETTTKVAPKKAKASEAVKEKLPELNGPIVRTFHEGKAVDTVFIEKSVAK